MVDLALGRVHQRIVGRRAELDRDLLLGEREDLELRADPLGSRAERVAVLAEQAGIGIEVDLGVLVDGQPARSASLDSGGSGGDALARLERRADVGGRLDLARVRSRDVVDELVELLHQRKRMSDTHAAGHAVHRLDGHRGEGLREQREIVRVVQGERGGRAGDGRAVDQAKALLRAEHNRLDAMLLERLIGEQDDRLAFVRAVDDADVAAPSARSTARRRTDDHKSKQR